MKTDICLLLMPAWGTTDVPLTLSSLSSYLRQEKLNVKVFDFNIELFHILSEYRKYWHISNGLDAWQDYNFTTKFYSNNYIIFESLIDDVLISNPSYVSFSVFTSNRLVSELFAKSLKAKAPCVKIIFGGPEVSYMEDLLSYSMQNQYIDFFVKGEGEETLKNIIKGVSTEKIIECKKTISNLDLLPLQDFSDFDFELYSDPFAFPVYSSRGCPNSCIYCTERVFMTRFRTKSAERLFEEIKTQKELYPFLKTFRLHESTSNGNIKQLERFCDLLIQSNIKINWAMNGAVMRKEMNAHLCMKLHKAGCNFINYGLETPSHDVLETIGKKLSRGTDFDAVVKDTYNSGIKVGLNIMFGLPSETEKEFDQQLDFLRRNHKYISCIAPSLWFCYFPNGSEGFKNPEKYGINLDYGSLYWSSEDGANNYLVRMRRFLEYTELMETLGVECVFGYPVLVDRMELAKKYCTNMAELGVLDEREIDKYLIEIKEPEKDRKRSITMFRNILRDIIYRIAPYSIHGAINEKARARVLEQRLNKILREKSMQNNNTTGHEH